MTEWDYIGIYKYISLYFSAITLRRGRNLNWTTNIKSKTFALRFFPCLNGTVFLSEIKVKYSRIVYEMFIRNVIEGSVCVPLRVRIVNVGCFGNVVLLGSR